MPRMRSAGEAHGGHVVAGLGGAHHGADAREAAVGEEVGRHGGVAPRGEAVDDAVDLGLAAEDLVNDHDGARRAGRERGVRGGGRVAPRGVAGEGDLVSVHGARSLSRRGRSRRVASGVHNPRGP
jgi:hypothetical protein